MKIKLSKIGNVFITSGVITVLFLFCFFTCNPAFAEDELSGSKIVAEVNGSAITAGNLNATVNSLMPRTYFHSSVSPEKLNEIKKKAMEQLINEELIFQEAKKQGLEAKKSEIKAELDAIKKSYSTEKMFKEALKEAGLEIKDIEEKIKRNLLINQLLDKEVKVSLTDKELEQHYNNNLQRFHEPASIGLKYIYMKFQPTEPDFRNKAKAKAEEALTKLKAGDDFAKIAWDYSDDMSKVKGGDIGFLHEGRLTPELEKAALSLEKGRISSLIENEYGFHIIKVVEKKESRQLTFPEIKEKLKKELTESYQTKNREKLMNRLRASAIIKYY
jgi:peptidyl-prolyl cis-trans isomerase C